MNIFKLIIRNIRSKFLIRLSKNYTKLLTDIKKDQLIVNDILTNYDIKQEDDKTTLTIIPPVFDYYKVVEGVDHYRIMNDYEISKKDIPENEEIIKAITPMQICDEKYYELTTKNTIFYKICGDTFYIIDKNYGIDNSAEVFRVFENETTMKNFYNENPVKKDNVEYCSVLVETTKYYKPKKTLIPLKLDLEKIPEEERTLISLIDSLNDIKNIGYYKIIVTK